MKVQIQTAIFLTLVLTSCQNPVGVEGVEVSGNDQANQVNENATPFQQAENGAIIPGQYIVVFKSEATDATARAREVLESLGLTLPGAVDHVYTHAIQGFAGRIPEGKLESLRSNPNVIYVEQDRVISITAKLGGGTSTRSPQVIPWGVARVNGGLNFSPGKTLWILDTGLDFLHQDLNCDKLRSISFVPRESSQDMNGHGTHVAGIAAAKNDAGDVVGVAPGAPVVAVKVLNRQGTGSISGVIAGVDYVAKSAQIGDVANMSLGGSVSQALDNAVTTAASKGIMFTIAAGNESKDANLSSPGRANGANIYTVSAIGIDDKWAYFSNFGNPPIDYAEPGVSILSLRLGGGTTTMSGTSMAAPHLAGILLTGGVGTNGLAVGDPDNSADPIGVVK